MLLEERIKAFEKLYDHLNGELLSRMGKSDDLAQTIQSATSYNNWFTEKNILKSLSAVKDSIAPEKIKKWIKQYKLNDNKPAKNVGLIMAGNIPLVGFHDMLSILISGNTLVARLSSDDRILPAYILLLLQKFEPKFSEYIRVAEGKFTNIDAIIATGNNNSARYFEYYFNKYPHIIRKNRNSAGILFGNETAEQLALLGNDIFQYFGLGCRNVSKLFVPEGYDFDLFYKGIFDHKYVLDNNKYCNNYDYNKTVYLMSKIKLLDNGFLLLKEDIGLSSPVSVLFYEYYKSEEQLKERLHMDANNLQCVVANKKITELAVGFGQTQTPQLWDYADNVDTINFLMTL